MMGAALVVAVLAVPPWLLATLAGPPLPAWPTAAQLRDWIADPLTAGTLTAGLTTLAWLLWFGLAYTIAVTVARRLRAGTRWLRRLPLPTPWQAAATSMAGAAALTTAHTPTAKPPAPPAPVSVDGLHQQHPDVAWTHTGEGVVVPGGWLPDESAQQVAAAASLVWLRRRRAYQPGHPTTDASQLTPLPDTVTAVQAAVTERQQSAATPGGAPAALPGLGVAFTGGGASDAARGVLVTRLLAALRDPSDTTRVLVTRAALTTLVPDIAAAGSAIPGLRVVETAEQASTLLSEPTRTPPAHGIDADLSELVLITDSLPSAVARRLAVLPLGRATVVTLGAGPLGATWHVDRHGHSRDDRTGQPGPRLCVLDRIAATDLLTVLTHPSPAAPDDAATAPPRADGGRARIPRQPGRDTPHTAWQPSATARGVQLRVLGRPALLVDGQPVAIRRSAALQVLVFLAVHPDGATTTQLVQAIWPGLPAHTVTGRLYTTLSDLRAAIRAATTIPVVGHIDDRYHLDHGHVDVDLWRLHAAAHHAATTHTSPTHQWQNVIDAYAGDLAAGHTWAWVDPPREATRRLVLDAYTTAAAAHTDPHQRLRLLQDALHVDPYNRTLHQLTADQLNALGDPDGAARLLHAYQQRLLLTGIAGGQPTPTPR